MSRSQMLKRSVAAAAGLTVLSSPGVALAARRSGEAAPPLKGRGFPIKTIVANAKKEGHLNVIALAARLGELRRDHLDVPARSTASRSRATTRTAAPPRRTRRSPR